MVNINKNCHLYKLNKFKLKLSDIILDFRLRKNVIQVLKVDNEISTQTAIRRANLSKPDGKQFGLSPVSLLLGIQKKEKCTKVHGHGYASHHN